VYLLVAALIGLGMAMIATTVWLVRATRRDHAVLGPLEVMGERGWRQRKEPDRLRDLDAARLPASGHLDPAVSGVALHDDAVPIETGDDAAEPEESEEPEKSEELEEPVVSGTHDGDPA